MKSYRIVLEYTERGTGYSSPSFWNWYDLLDISNGDEAVSVVSIEDIPTPEGHIEDLEKYTDE